jgi:hypothetical protein
VQVDIEIKTHFPHEAFGESKHAGHGRLAEQWELEDKAAYIQEGVIDPDKMQLEPDQGVPPSSRWLIPQ